MGWVFKKRLVLGFVLISDGNWVYGGPPGS